MKIRCGFWDGEDISLAHIDRKAAASKPRRRNTATRAGDLLPHLPPPKK
jgi:hypothetical protein